MDGFAHAVDHLVQLLGEVRLLGHFAGEGQRGSIEQTPGRLAAPIMCGPLPLPHERRTELDLPRVEEILRLHLQAIRP
jgi:hypothetical protein